MIALTAVKPWSFSWPVWMPAWMPPVNPESITFAVRAWIASLVALYIAFVVQIESPVWAMQTCWIVTTAMTGMTLSKSISRFAGTIGGAFFGIVLMALFAQTPELFIFALALLVGGCTVISNLVTNNRAYGTALIAYTAGIVASDAINAPDRVFHLAMARGAAILVGAGCAMVFASIFGPHRAEADARKKLAELLKGVSHRAVVPWQAPNEERIKIGRKLVTDAIALNTLVEFAAAESGVFRLQANNARSLIAHFFGMISARRSIDARLRRCGWPVHDALQIFHGVVIDLLNDVPSKLDDGKVSELISQVGEVRRQLALLQPEDDSDDVENIVSARLIIDRSDDLLEHLSHALINWRDILEERCDRTPTRQLNFHRDTRAAWINGARAFVAVCITGAFWIGSAWPHGPTALIYVSVVLSLLSALPRPDIVSWMFFLVTIPGVVLGMLVKYFVLSANSGFDYLVVVSGFIFIPFGLFLSNPATNIRALPFVFAFLSIANVSNPMVYDFSDSMNTALATEFGVLVGIAAYILIFPPDPHGARWYVTYRIRRGLEQLASTVPIPPFYEWETRMYDRVNRLYDPDNPSGTHTDEWYDAGLGALTLGNEILRLRDWLAEGDVPANVRSEVEKIIAAISHIRRKPEPAFAALQGGRARILEMDPGRGDPGRRCWARVVGALEEMEVYLGEHPRLLNRAPIP